MVLSLVQVQQTSQYQPALAVTPTTDVSRGHHAPFSYQLARLECCPHRRLCRQEPTDWTTMTRVSNSCQYHPSSFSSFLSSMRKHLCGRLSPTLFFSSQTPPACRHIGPPDLHLELLHDPFRNTHLHFYFFVLTHVRRERIRILRRRESVLGITIPAGISTRVSMPTCTYALKGTTFFNLP